MNPLALIASLVGVAWLYKKSKETPAKTTDTTTDTKTTTTATVINPNLVTDPSIETISNEYGFAIRDINLEQGKTYTFSANGFVTKAALAAKQVLCVYILLQDGSFSQVVVIKGTTAETQSVTFTAPISSKYVIIAYPVNPTIPFDDWLAVVKAGGTEKVYVSWYKMEEGNLFTGIN